MKNALLLVLIAIAIVMIVVGIKASILAPALTGLGFIVIAALFYTTNKK